VLRQKGALVEKKDLITIHSARNYPEGILEGMTTVMASKDRKLMGRLREKIIV